jgi:hypothetical protein
METKFNFKSQVATSREQSERLLALGLKKETADMTHHYLNSIDSYELKDIEFSRIMHLQELVNKKPVLGRSGDDLYAKDIPAWSLHRLIKMMPESIHLDSFANTHYNRTLLPSKIIYMKYDHTWIWQSDKQNDFDKCVDTIEWLIKQGYFPKEYLV